LAYSHVNKDGGKSHQADILFVSIQTFYIKGCYIIKKLPLPEKWHAILFTGTVVTAIAGPVMPGWDYLVVEMPPTALSLSFFNLPTLSLLWVNKLEKLRMDINKNQLLSNLFNVQADHKVIFKSDWCTVENIFDAGRFTNCWNGNGKSWEQDLRF